MANKSVQQDGGIGIRILWIALTLALVTLAIFWLLDRNQEDIARHDRKAIELSEYGLLIALDHVRANPSWAGKIDKTEFEGGAYAVSSERRILHDTTFLILESQGFTGTISRSQKCILRLSITGSDSSWVRQSVQ